MRNCGGQLFDRRTGRTFRRDASDTGRMGRRPALDVLGLIPTTAHHERIIEQRIDRNRFPRRRLHRQSTMPTQTRTL
jgi:hypothetical protein